MKKKKPLSERLPTPLFIVLMMLVQAIGLGAGIAIYSALFQMTTLQGIVLTIVAAIPSLLVVLGESLLLKLQFRWSASRWLLASLIGLFGFYSWGSLQTSLLGSFRPALLLPILSILPIIIYATAQFVVLRRYVKRAWLWILALLVTNTLAPPLYELVANLTANIDALGSFNTSLVGAIQGLFLGTVLTILLRLTISDEKQQLESQYETDADTARLQEHSQQTIEPSEDELPNFQKNTISGKNA